MNSHGPITCFRPRTHHPALWVGHLWPPLTAPENLGANFRCQVILPRSILVRMSRDKDSILNITISLTYLKANTNSLILSSVQRVFGSSPCLTNGLFIAVGSHRGPNTAHLLHVIRVPFKSPLLQPPFVCFFPKPFLFCN